ncbi:MAG TPA: siphovirus Gp157 family protein [Candidatus Jeotgalibaca pullicola]|nr:siphovirus Gp157 family protein [Candidatus Jeotgalibaca pullicola]
MKTLYDIAEEYRELLDLMQSAEVDEETIQDTIEATGLKDDFRNKVDGYLYVIDDLEASNKRIKNEENRLAERRRMQERNAKKMKDMLTDTMQLLDIQKERTDRYTVWVQNNPIKLNIEDEQFIPKEFYEEQQPKLNRKMLTDYLKENKNKSIKGVELTQTKGMRKR